MTFIQVMATLFGFVGAVSVYFFRKGGPYNPNVTSTDNIIAEISVSTPEPAPMTQPVATTPPMTMLERFCHAIEANEGGPNDASHRNCNPGNFRCSPVGYLPKYGKVGCSPGGFAVFSTYQLGWEYLVASVHYRAVRHPEWTVLDFFKDYAPVTDKNNPFAYAHFVATWCGTTVDKHLSELFA